MQYASSTENYSSSKRDSPSRWSGRDNKGYSYKKSSYQYSSSGNNSSSYQSKNNDQNIDQLDALLEDLKNERQITTRERELVPTSSYRAIEREHIEPGTPGTVTKTTRVIKTTKQLGPQQHMPDDIETFSTSDYSTLKSANYSSFQDTTKRDNDKVYGLAHSPSGGVGGHYESKTKLFESNRTLSSTELIPTNTISTNTISKTTNIDKELQDIVLGDDILPMPGTKVTTTVRTYTYEIPADGSATTNTINRSQRQLNNITYNSLQQHETNTSRYPSPTRPNVPQTVVYNTESYSTVNKNQERPIVTNQSYEIREHKETTNTVLNSPLGNGTAPAPISPVPNAGSTGPSTSRAVIYNIHKTDNVHTINAPERYPYSPRHSPSVLAPQNIVGPHSPSLNTLPPGGTSNRYYYKETSNVVNTIHGPGGPIEPNLQSSKLSPNTAAYPPHSSPTPAQHGNGYPPHPDGYPPTTNTYSYKYSSTTTTNNRHGPGSGLGQGPDYGIPSPFPVDGIEYPTSNGNPPQRVEELMQSFGNTDAVDRANLESPHRKREIETAVATPNQQHVPTINRAGKEVYYPPGHDTIITKREEMAAGSAGGGRWAKGAGMYEYESGYKSKSKSKTDGAMVPVCLPLCCAMPCSIM